MSTKLHELLAVEDNLGQAFKATLAEADNAFKQRLNVFVGRRASVKATRHDEDGSAACEEMDEIVDVADTIPGTLRRITRSVANYLDVVSQKEEANTRAKADLILDGETVLKDAPATMLLALESRLKLLRGVVAAIPTHDMSRGWTESADGEPHVWEDRGEIRAVTRKTQRERVVIQPTEHQPGQFTMFTEDVIVGEKTIKNSSGLVSPAEKTRLVDRCARLINACKQARQRANETEADVDLRVGDVLMSYLLSGPRDKSAPSSGPAQET